MLTRSNNTYLLDYLCPLINISSNNSEMLTRSNNTYLLDYLCPLINISSNNSEMLTRSNNTYLLDYLCPLINISSNNSEMLTRSNNTYLLDTVPKYKLHSTNCRSFSISAPYLCNSLPPALRTITSTLSFKKELKTHLFNNSFE